MKISIYLREGDAKILCQLRELYTEIEPRARVTDSWVIRQALWNDAGRHHQALGRLASEKRLRSRRG